MIDAQLPLQAAIVDAVKSSAAMTALIVGRMYDKVPTNTAVTFPYGEIKGMDSVDASDACHNGVEVFADLAFHSQKPGTVEAKQIGAAAVVLLDAALSVDGFNVIVHEVVRTRTVKDSDGLSSRQDVSLRYVLEPST